MSLELSNANSRDFAVNSRSQKIFHSRSHVHTHTQMSSECQSELLPLYALWEVADAWRLLDLRVHSKWLQGDNLARAQQALHQSPVSLMYERNVSALSASSAAEEVALSLASGPPDVPSHLECYCSETIGLSVPDTGAPAASLSPLALHFAPALHPWLPSSPALAAELLARGLEPASVGDVLGALITSAVQGSEAQVYGEHVYVGDLHGGDGHEMRALLAEAGDSLWCRLLGELCDAGRTAPSTSARRLSQRSGNFTLVIATREDGGGGDQELQPPGPSAEQLYGRRRRQRALAAALAVSGHELPTHTNGIAPPAGSPSNGLAACTGERTGGMHDPRGLSALLVLPRNDATSRQALKVVLQRANRVVRDALCGVTSTTAAKVDPKVGLKRRR